MKRRKIFKRIGQAAEKRRVLCLSLSKGGEARDVLPLSFGEKLLLGRAYGDFAFDGCCLLRLRDIRRAKPLNQVLAYIAKREALLEEERPQELDLSSWRAAFEGLRARGQNVIVEGRAGGKGERPFFIGRILKVRRHSFDFRHFNAFGEWDGMPRRIAFKSVGAVRFGSRYETVFSKYVGDPPAKERE